MTTPGSSPDYEERGPDKDLDLRRFLWFALRRWWIVAVCILLFLVAGIAYLWTSPRIYEAVAIVEVHKPRQVMDDLEADREDFRSEEILKTIERKLKRQALFRRVMVRPDVRGNAALSASFPAGTDPLSEDELARLLDDWTTVKLEGGTLLIKVTVEHQSPDVAKLLADAIVNEFIQERFDWQVDSSDTALRFLRDEEAKARAALEQSEERLYAFQKFEDALALKNKIEAQKDLVLELSQRYGDKHPKIVTARAILADLNRQLRTQLTPPGGTAARSTREAPSAGDGPGLGRMNEDLIGPAVEEPDREARPDPRPEEERLADDLNALKGRYNALTREVESNRVIYEGITSRLKQTDLSQNWQLIPLRIVEPAFASPEPTKPNKMLAIGGPVILGGGMGLCLLFVLCASDRTVRTLGDTAHKLQLPVLGAIPNKRRLQTTSRRGKARRRTMTDLKAILRQRHSAGVIGSRPVKLSGRSGEPLAVLANPVGPAAEALRTIRAELGAKGSSGDSQSVLVTSAVAREGKSFVAANIAASFAMEEKSPTLLIDANLRAPVIHTLLDVEVPENGFVEALAGKCPWRNAVVDSGIPNLDVLLAGGVMANPAEFLSGDNFPRLIRELRERYQRIVIDSTHVKSTADTLLLAPHVDFTVLVVRAARTSWSEAARARDLLADMGRPPAGVVLNRATA